MAYIIPNLYSDLAEKFYKRKLQNRCGKRIDVAILYDNIETWLWDELEWDVDVAEDAAQKVLIGLKRLKYLEDVADKDSDDYDGPVYKILRKKAT